MSDRQIDEVYLAAAKEGGINANNTYYAKTVMVAVLTAEAQQKGEDEVHASIVETVRSVNDKLEKHARIGAVILTREPWTIENEVLTPTLNIKRDKVEQKFGEIAEPLAHSAAQQGELLIHWHS